MAHARFSAPSIRWAVYALACLLGAGCGGKLPTVSDIKDAVVGTDKPAKDSKATSPSAARAGDSFEFDVGGSIRTAGCVAELISVSPDRPTILQLTSYRSPEAESFPSCLVRGEVTAATLADLAGKKIQVQVFLTSGPEDQVWHTALGAPAELTLESAGPDSLSGELTGGQLVNSAGASPVPAKGRFTAHTK